MNRIYFTIITTLFAVSATAQNDRDYIRRGNRLMKDTVPEKLQEKSLKAQVQYQKAVEYDNTNATAHYDLGNALLVQNKAEEAMKEYDTATRFEKDRLRKAKMYHNMGVVMQGAKQYDKAVAFYRQSLRNDPTNDETRYNYALSLYLLKKQQQEGGGQDNQEQDQNGQDEKNQQDQNEQQKQDRQNDQKEEQKPQPEQNQMSKENAEQLLNAAMQDEKETQEKLQKTLAQPQRKRLQKQW